MTLCQINNLISHAAYACLAGGTALVAADIHVGWAVRMAADLLFAFLGMRLGLCSMMGWSVLFLGVDAYGWLR